LRRSRLISQTTAKLCFYQEEIEDFDADEMDTSTNAGKNNSPTGFAPPPHPIDGTRVIIDIPSEGEIKISFKGDVNTRTFQFVNGILELQKKMFPETEQLAAKIDSEHNEQ